MVIGINFVFKFVNSWEIDELKVYFSFWSILSSVMLEIIEILFIIVSFILDREIFIFVFFWLDIGRRLLFVFFGIIKVVLIVVLFMFMIEIFVSVINRIVGRLVLFFVCLNVLVVVWYIVFIKWFLLDLGFLVI